MPKRAPSKRLADLDAKKKKEEADQPSSYAYGEWNIFGQKNSKGVQPLVYFAGPGIPSSHKIAAFDLDFTLVSTKSGRKFPLGPDDWKILNDKVIPKIQSVHKDGYKIVIISNQGGIEKQHTSVSDVTKKFDGIVSEFGIPIQVFFSTGESHFRKPATGMWDFMVEKCNDGLAIDTGNSYYVGDAAGRAKDWSPGKPKDFSCGDRMFALNVGINFCTPEGYFENQPKAPFSMRSIDPVEILTKAKSGKKFVFVPSQSPELIMMVGPPASGKSTFCKQYLEPNGYIVVNRDTLKTQAKCIQVFKSSIAMGKSVVIDNTNPNKATRREYIDIAKKAKVPSRCFILKTPIELAHHLNLFRQSQTKGNIRRIPDVAYNTYKSRYEEPVVSEGFVEVIPVDFEPHFASKKHEELFKKWTC